MSNEAMEIWGTTEEQSVPAEVSVDQLVALVKQLRKLKNDKENLENIIEPIKEDIKKVEKDILSALKSNSLTSFKVPEMGTVFVKRYESWATPKDTESKAKLFKYITDKYGADALLGMQSIHSATLNSWAKGEAEQGVMQIDGLELPSVNETIQMRRA